MLKRDAARRCHGDDDRHKQKQGEITLANVSLILFLHGSLQGRSDGRVLNKHVAIQSTRALAFSTKLFRACTKDAKLTDCVGMILSLSGS